MVNHARGLLGAFIAGSLMFSSTAASASAAATPVQQPDPWAVLSAMSNGAPADTMCGGAVQSPNGCVLALNATQQENPPPPPPPPAPVPPISAPRSGLGIDPLILGLIALAAGVGIYLAVHHHNNNSNSPA